MKTLKQRLGGRARFNQPMSAHTTWGVGGPAWSICSVHDAPEALFVIRETEKAKFCWMPLGRGSNLLVSDEGYPGVMLRLTGDLAKIHQEETGLWASGGAYLSSVVNLAARLGLSGLEWAAGIPATVGGAVANNTGAVGFDMKQVVGRLRLLMPSGEVEESEGGRFPAGYRKWRLPAGSLVLAARLDLHKERPREVKARTADALKKRRASQPHGQRSAGSVFKNPPDDFAGRLIEKTGCKGLSVGDAVVSEKHANFIVNQGGAQASQIRDLMQEVARRVRTKTGIKLEPEVEIIGRA